MDPEARTAGPSSPRKRGPLQLLDLPPELLRAIIAACEALDNAELEDMELQDPDDEPAPEQLGEHPLMPQDFEPSDIFRDNLCKRIRALYGSPAAIRQVTAWVERHVPSCVKLQSGRAHVELNLEGLDRYSLWSLKQFLDIDLGRPSLSTPSGSESEDNVERFVVSTSSMGAPAELPAAPPSAPPTPTKQTGLGRLTLQSPSAKGAASVDEEEEGRPLDCIEALYLTNKQLHELVKPTFWYRADFEGDKNASLANFEERCLTKFAPLIKEIYLRQAVDQEEQGFYDEEDEDEESLQFAVRPRIKFLLKCLDQTSSLIDLDIDVLNYGPTAQTQNYHARLMAAIVRHPLERLTLHSADSNPVEFQLPQPWTAMVISQLPNLTRIELLQMGDADYEDRLPAVLASLQHLKELHIADSELSQAWDEVSFTSPPLFMSILDLPEQHSLAGVYEHFIENNASQLLHLETDSMTIRSRQSLLGWDVDGEDEAQDTPETAYRPLRLPKLRHLTFELIQGGTDIFDRFRGCPIQILEVQVDNISPSSYCTFVRSKIFPELKELRIGEAEDEDYAELKGECKEHGVKLLFVLGHDDDDDFEEEDDSFGDSDMDDFADEDGWGGPDDFGGDDVVQGDEEWETDESDGESLDDETNHDLDDFL